MSDTMPGLLTGQLTDDPFAVLQFQKTSQAGSLRNLLIEKGIVLRDMDGDLVSTLAANGDSRIISRYEYNKLSDGKTLWLLEVSDVDLDGDIVFKSWIVNKEPTTHLVDHILSEYPPHLYEAIEASTFVHAAGPYFASQPPANANAYTRSYESITPGNTGNDEPAD